LAQLAVDDGQEEEGAPVDGSQYSSEGEPYELEEYKLYSEMDGDNAGPELVMLVVNEPAVGSAKVAFWLINVIPPEKERWAQTPLVVHKSKEPKARPPWNNDDM
jgi:hypothetical protein